MSSSAERARQLIEYRPETGEFMLTPVRDEFIAASLKQKARAAYAAKAIEFYGEFARTQ
jgi:hypothetical protein